MRSRSIRTFGTWLALVAMLMVAFAPLVSSAMQAASSALVEVCTPTGSKWMSLATGKEAVPDTPQAPGAHHLEHCPYCSLHAHGLAMPPAPAAFTFLSPLGQAVPAAFLHAPAPLHAWRGAQPRAPPQLG